MSSIWKDLLFLHGHLVRQQDLEWRVDATPPQDVSKVTPSLPQAASATHPDDCCTTACA